MKRISSLLVCLGMACCVLAQDDTTSTPSVSGGFIGAGNYSRFKITDRGNLPLESKWKWGYAAGMYFNFPVSRGFSIEPQVLFSTMGSYVENNSVEISNQQINYLSVPLLMKFHLGHYVALAVGPQFDFSLWAKERRTKVDNKDNFKGTSIGATGGIEFFPHGRVSLYGRYTHGLTKIQEPSNNPPYAYNQLFQAGLKFKLFGNAKKPAPLPPPPPAPPVIVDSDNDGVADSLDKCPTVPGIAKYNGCPIPDSDGDGVNDEEDKCPQQAGSPRYNGCPVPDSDGDGINDDEDKCPKEKGVAKYNGCPVPDGDKDGIPDSEDKCPGIAGVPENGGCPAIPKFNANNIQFVTGKATLTAAAVRELTEIVEYLNKYQQIKLEIDGHTDNVGKAASNQLLSEKRAASVKAALVKRGIASDRLTTVGHGMDQPIEDNSTPAGRARNRRVEFRFAE
ncbi:OmpA family protein [Terrimonas sp. NA20]|uniref:OmpA family protein n=1 Tax=Terrimonas ginsenosidimutans TaxID=2908004 RepID=A0ABS9KZQ2_9BACT|nr:OmpA family protein [Terrimonas ginsenosidimutans]MCG2617816.1 OmpA family protein [Terrimonas ginsenosidimutans]